MFIRKFKALLSLSLIATIALGATVLALPTPANADTGLTATPPTFPDTAIGSSAATQIITVTNVVNATLTFGNSAISISGSEAAEYTIEIGSDNCTGQTLQVEDSCTIGIVFSPSGLMERFAFLDFTNDISGPYSVSLVGIGTEPAVSRSFSATYLNFPDTAID